MDESTLNQKTTALVIRDFGLEAVDETMSEAQLFELLCNEVAYMIEYRIDFLMSLMYRLDVLEHKINFALSPVAPEPANIGLARLILERQKQRVRTKQVFKQEKPDDLDDALKF